jgi:ketosteroid isomerase-like protein
MAAASPDETARVFVAALNSRDLETALAQWSEDAVLLPAGPEGSPVEGKRAIRGVLEALIETATELQIVTSHTYVAGQSAVRAGRLRLIIKRADGPQSTSELDTDFLTVYAKSVDGWRIVFDAPAGLPSA